MRVPSAPLNPAGYAAVVFDMDGVLVDSEPIHFRVMGRLLADEGRILDEAAYRAYIGMTLRATWQDLHGRYALHWPLDWYLRCYDDAIAAALAEPLDPAPGAHRLVTDLRNRGIPLAVASSSQRRWVEATLHGIGLHDAFAVIVAGDEVRRGKPDPEIFLRAAARLGVPPGGCLVIEDAPHGVRAARAARMDVVAVRTPHVDGDLLAEATAVVDTLEALLPPV